MRAFAEIYFAFESQWAFLISPTKTTEISPRVQNLLRTLYHPSLLRTTRLEHDLTLLSGQHPNSQRLGHPSLTPLTSQIVLRLQSSPHTLLAYAWIMYLALFNGGRWIRSQLLFPNRNTSSSSSSSSSSTQFWRPRSGPDAEEEEDCLTFWKFDGDQDGEDIKTGFQTRFEVLAAESLTEAERQDVVEEAVEIFKMCGRVVEELDLHFGVDTERWEARPSAPAAPPSNLLRLSLVPAWTSRLIYGILVWILGSLLVPVRKGGRAGPGGAGPDTEW